MFKENVALYLGEEKNKGFSGFIAEERLFLVLDCEEGLDYLRGHQILTSIRDAIKTTKISSLNDFESFLGNQITIENIPITSSIAAGFIVDSTIYFKTTSQGEIFVLRNSQYQKLIDGNNTASGFLKEHDYFIFTTSSFSELIGKEKDVGEILRKKSPHEVVDELVPVLKSHGDQGIVAVFVQMVKQEDISAGQYTEDVKVEEPLEEPLFKSYRHPLEPLIERIGILRRKLFFGSQAPRSKKVTFTILIVIVILLVWSVGLASKRRQAGIQQKKIQHSRELINAKLNQAEEVAFFNLQRSLILINEAKSELSLLKRGLPDPNVSEVGEIESLISQKEKAITKKEEKNFEEFFDLTVDEKTAKGDIMYKNEDTIVILNKSGGKAYILSLTQKSLQRKNVAELTRAKFIALYQDRLYFFVPEKGVYLLEDSKAKRVINNDSEWGEINQMVIYNGNIYLLDSSKGTIYKYLVAEEGFSDKQSYFGSSSGGSVKNAKSLAIDSSVYVSYEDIVQKFTNGEQDAFSTSYPSEDVKITKVITDKDLEKVYVWSKEKQAIYILGKNGTYEREIKSKAFGQASDVAVYEENAYILAGAKILKVSLE